MKDSLSTGLDKAGQTVDALAEKAQQASASITTRITEQKEAINRVTSDLNRMEKQLTGMKPGTAQVELSAEVNACRRVLDEERVSLQYLEKQHLDAEKAVRGLRKGTDNLSASQAAAGRQSKSLTERIAEQQGFIKQVEADIAELEKAYQKTAPGNAQLFAGQELNAAKKALDEDKVILSALQAEQDKTGESSKRLSMRLRELQDNLAKMRLDGRDNTDQYREMAVEAANLADTVADLRQQTSVLSNDDANLQGFMSGVSGLSGAFTVATGALSLFAGENEDLVKIQTRVQSVMAITMGLQQVFNTLNKDSAFRLVTVAKMKNLLTAANARLAVSLGISNIAAQSLMATLTLGLSVVITGLIIAWDRYSATQEEAARKTKEMAEVESAGRAQAIKARFEMESTLKTLKNFTGNKEKEKAQTEELNRTYGKSFGYYDTVAKWYDVLKQKSEDYIQMLYLQAKAQALVNKATTADEKVQELKAGDANSSKYSVSWIEKAAHYYTQGQMANRGQSYNASQIITDKNKKRKEKEIEDAETEREKALSEARTLQDQIDKIGKDKNIGGYSAPKNNKNAENEQKKKLELEKKMDEEMQKLRRANRQKEINEMKESTAKRIAQIRLDYEQEIAEILAQEKKWTEQQKGKLTPEQSQIISKAYEMTEFNMEDEVKKVEDDEVKKGKEKLNALLDEYQTYDQRRREIDTSYANDMKIYNAELDRIKKTGGDTTQINASITARNESYKNAIRSLENDILKSADFYSKLFSDTSEKGYKALKDFYDKAKATLDTAQVDLEGVKIDIPVKDESGKFVTKSVKITVDEFIKMKNRVNGIKDDLSKSNPFKALQNSYSDLVDAIKNNGDVSGALTNLNAKGKEVTATIKGWGESLGAVFGDRFSQSLDEMITFADGVMDMGTGIAQIYSGDIVGGITTSLNGLSSIVSMFTAWKEKMEEMKRMWYIAEIETNRAIRQRNEELVTNRDTIQDIIKNQELLNWLIKNGYSKPSSSSAWETQSAALDEYLKNLEAGIRESEELWKRLQGSDAHWEWGNSLNGESVTQSLKGMSAQQIQLYYNQGKLTKEAADYYEAWVESGKSIEELKKNIEECYASMQEMVMGASFDGFLNNVKSVLQEARGDISKFADFTEETLAQAILNSFMYKDLAKGLEPLYNELSEHLINGTADKNYIAEWKKQFQEYMLGASDRLDQIEDAAGVDLSSGAESQSGKANSFTSLSQEQGTKLEGLMTAEQIHSASIDENVDNIVDGLGTAVDHLRSIDENTEETNNKLIEILTWLEKYDRDGLKIN